MSNRNELVDIEVEVLKVNPESVHITDGKVKTFLPKSLLKDENENPVTSFTVGETVTLYIPLWLAEDRNLV